MKRLFAWADRMDESRARKRAEREPDFIDRIDARIAAKFDNFCESLTSWFAWY